MNKEERVKRYGAAAYERRSQQSRDWEKTHREEHNASNLKWVMANPTKAKLSNQKWCAANPDKVKARDQEYRRKGGKYFESTLKYNTTELRRERNSIRERHRREYCHIKGATPNSVLHHEWIPGTSKYRGVVLVDKELHQRGIIKVIKLLEGEVTLFLEKEVKNQEV